MFIWQKGSVRIVRMPFGVVASARHVSSTNAAATKAFSAESLSGEVQAAVNVEHDASHERIANQECDAVGNLFNLPRPGEG